MKFLKGFFTIFFTLIIFALLICVPYIGAVSNTIASPKAFTDIIVKSGISKEIKESFDEVIDEGMEKIDDILKDNSNVKKEDIPKIKEEVRSILNGFSTEENINYLLEEVLTTTYKNENVDVKKLVKNNVDKVIKDNNISVSENTYNEINRFINDIGDEANNKIVESLNGDIKINSDDTIINPIPIVINALKFAQLIVIGIILVFIVLVILINLKSKAFGFISLAVGTLLSGIFVLLANSILIFAKDSVVITNADDQVAIDFVKNLLDGIAKSANVYGVIYVIIAILMIAGTIILKRINKKDDIEVTPAIKVD